MLKTMVVSYNPIHGAKLGRFEKGSAVAYSADYDWRDYAEAVVMAFAVGSPGIIDSTCSEQHDAAENALSNLAESLAQDLGTIEVIYVYVGVSAMDGAMKFIKKVQELGKKVHMIACDCERDVKERFAQKLGIDITWTCCGGEDKCGEIFTRLSTVA